MQNFYKFRRRRITARTWWGPLLPDSNSIFRRSFSVCFLQEIPGIPGQGQLYDPIETLAHIFEPVFPQTNWLTFTGKLDICKLQKDFTLFFLLFQNNI